jgi:hypothetical protein
MPAIRWLRERCGKSEEVHSVMKSDLAGGQLPSGLFGANAAWWALTILAHNLNAAMKRLVLGSGWLPKRMKALRLRLIALPGPGGEPRPQADYPTGHGRRGAAVGHLCPSGDPGAGLRTVRMINRSRSHRGLPPATRLGGNGSLFPLAGHRTRGGCRPYNQDSPAVRPGPNERLCRCQTEPRVCFEPKIAIAPTRPAVCSGILGLRTACKHRSYKAVCCEASLAWEAG